MTPAVSVVVPVLDMASTIGACLEALVAQSLPQERREIIVVDNGSTDGTRDVVGRYPVSCLLEERRGAPCARNRGLLAARGDYVAFTDADCVPARTWLLRLLSAAAASGADTATGTLAVLDPAESLLASYSALIGQYDTDVSMTHPRFPYGVTANLAVRRSLLVEAGGFDERFSCYDAAELFWRLGRRASLRSVVERRAVVFYRTRRTVRALARQNYEYGRYYARFCRMVPAAGDAVRPGAILRRWARHVGAGMAHLPADAGWPRAAGLRAVHVVRETALAAGTLAGLAGAPL